MNRALYALHILFAIALVGPLIHVATTAGRGVRQGDRSATTASSRMAWIYGIGSVLVVVLGFALLGTMHAHHRFGAAPSIGQVWVWLSLLAWVVSVALVLLVVVPALTEATRRIDVGEATGGLAARVSAAGGVAALLLVLVVFLMVYQPGR